MNISLRRVVDIFDFRDWRTWGNPWHHGSFLLYPCLGQWKSRQREKRARESVLLCLRYFHRGELLCNCHWVAKKRESSYSSLIQGSHFNFYPSHRGSSSLGFVGWQWLFLRMWRLPIFHFAKLKILFFKLYRKKLYLIPLNGVTVLWFIAPPIYSPWLQGGSSFRTPQVFSLHSFF